MPRGVKKTAQERLARRIRIEALLAQDVGRCRISRMVAEEFGVSARQARKDLGEVEAEWSSDDQAVPAHKRRLYRKRVLEALYRKCLATGDLRTAVAVQDRLCKIDGVYAPEVVVMEPPTAADSLPVLTSQNVRGRIVELLDKARSHAAAGVIEARSLEAGTDNDDDESDEG